MTGLYIHIPFCKSRCSYCDFYSVTGSRYRSAWLGALVRELDLRKDYVTDNHVDTVYFGGGTPSLPSPGDLAVILDRIRRNFILVPDAEITLEANPDDLDEKRIREYLEMGFNRISIGIQSFRDEHLHRMNRRHDAAQAVRAVEMSSSLGFRRISIDLIYGIPGMTPEEWEENLMRAVALPANHLSAYHLTIEPGTPFGKMKERGELQECDEETSVNQYLALLRRLGEAGFEQYEISNFARNGEYSRHNSKYWSGDHYIGFGPSAHSFSGTVRSWNPSALQPYLRMIGEGREPEGEILTDEMRYNEFIMTRLRTARGISLPEFEREFGADAREELMSAAAEFVRSGDLILRDNRLSFDPPAWFRSDGILASLFRVR